jgi:hypothetical protein
MRVIPHFEFQLLHIVTSCKKANHIPDEEGVFLLVSGQHLLLRDINSIYAAIHNTITPKSRFLNKGRELRYS